jgi:hypothetical protein
MEEEEPKTPSQSTSKEGEDLETTYEIMLWINRWSHNGMVTLRGRGVIIICL